MLGARTLRRKGRRSQSSQNIERAGKAALRVRRADVDHHIEATRDRVGASSLKVDRKACRSIVRLGYGIGLQIDSQAAC